MVKYHLVRYSCCSLRCTMYFHRYSTDTNYCYYYYYCYSSLKTVQNNVISHRFFKDLCSNDLFTCDMRLRADLKSLTNASPSEEEFSHSLCRFVLKVCDSTFYADLMVCLDLTNLLCSSVNLHKSTLSPMSHLRYKG